ncbi:MAG: patatin-like phospholipase family protein [Bacteroidota bacterium]
MRALVISGGGAKGAFAGGIAEHLILEEQKDYDIYVGTSAGSLLLPLLALGEVKRLKTAFLKVTQKDIFANCPFTIKKKGRLYSSKINHFNSVKMFWKKRTTFGDSSNLRKLISRIFLEEDYNRLIKSGKNVIVTVCNFTNFKTEYKSILDHSYKDFCDWMWISANFVPFMSLVIKNGHEYADGGYGDYLPVHPALDLGAKYIDAIYLRPEKLSAINLRCTDPFDVLLRTLQFMMDKIGKDDILIGKYKSVSDNSAINYYFAPHVLVENAFIFDPELMQRLWAEGLSYARNKNPQKVQTKEDLPN